ncbi:AAWKG family protein [Streptomyces coelicoflavus]
MVDRYDPNSKDNVSKFDDVGDVRADTWADLVRHLTGYPVPDRKTVFDDLRSSHGGKLFRMEITERNLGQSLDSGFLTTKGEDYAIWFFKGGKDDKIMQARIVFEGRVKVGNEIHFENPGSDNVRDANVREGNEFKDYHKDSMSTVPLARYMNGPRAALLALLDGSTENVRFSDLGVPPGDVVDLNSLNTAGESFDFAAKFFKDHAVVLKDWEDRFGKDDASWKGAAAKVFRDLLEKIRDNYDGYVETFDSPAGPGGGAGTGNTVYSRALALARKYLTDSANALLEAWLAWAKSPYYDPHQVLRFVLDELGRWMDENNVMRTELQAGANNVVVHKPRPGFTSEHPEYGDLADIANWAKVGDKAVEIWHHGIDAYLGTPAARVQSNLNNHFLDLSKDFSGNHPKPRTTSTTGKGADGPLTLNGPNGPISLEDLLNGPNNPGGRPDQNYGVHIRNGSKGPSSLNGPDGPVSLEDLLNGPNGPGGRPDQDYGVHIQNGPTLKPTDLDGSARPAPPGAIPSNPRGPDGPSSIDKLLGDLDNLNGSPNPNDSAHLAPLGEVPKNLAGPGGPGDPDTVNKSLGDLDNLNGSPNPNGPLQAAHLAPLGTPLASPGRLNRGAAGDLGRLDDGRIASAFPDGSRSVFDPDTGALTTTSPDGTTTVTDLTHGAKVTNPDGSTTVLDSDGKLTTTYPDGTTRTVDPTTGETVTTRPDGTTTTEKLGDLGNLNGRNGPGTPGDLPGLETPTGGRTALDEGDFTTTYPDGSRTSFDPDTGALTTTRPDGTTTVTDLTHGAKVTNPDGSTTLLDNGRLVTSFPDGSRQVLDPETGIVTVTDPQGNTRTVDLGELNSPRDSDRPDQLDSPGLPDRPERPIDLPDGINLPDRPNQPINLPDGINLPDRPNQPINLPDGINLPDNFGSPGGLNGNGGDGIDRRDVPVAGPSRGGVGLAGGVGDSDVLATGASAATSAAPPVGAAGSGLGFPAVPGAPGIPGTPGTPGMPMGGGMGAGGDKGNGERVRAVLVDALEESERRSRRRRGPWNRQEDDDTFLAPASRVPTTGGHSADEEQPGRRPTSSADYLEEETDVWGTEEGGAPAVIGR